MPTTAELRATVAQAVRAELERREQLKARKAAAEADLMAFVRMFWRVVEPSTKLVEGWPLSCMCDALMAVADGHMHRMILNVFPGAMKSLLLNVFYPAWLWGPQRQPHLRFLSGSYSTSLPERDNDRFRRVVQDEVYQRLWGDQVKLTREGLTLVENSRTGWKRTISVGSGTTGHRADYILLDDANDPNTVESDAVREASNLWLREVLPDRLNNLDTGVIICIQQRTHEQDATGTLAMYGTNYSWIMIPMEYDPLRDTPVPIRWDDQGRVLQWFQDPRGLDEYGRRLEGLYNEQRGQTRLRPGSPMALVEGMLAWPARFSPDAVTAMKKIKGPWAFASQYQQTPTSRGGGIIRRDWWRLWDSPVYPPMGTVVAALDTAIKEGEQNDYNAFVAFGAFVPDDAVLEDDGEHPRLMLTAAWEDRMSLAELVERVARSCWDQRVDYLLIEDKARGHDVAAEILRQYGRDVTWQTTLVPANGRGAFSGDKTSRLTAISPMFSGDVRRVPKQGGMPGEVTEVWTGGLIYEPGRDWSQAVVDQVCNFPNAAHDDLCDAVSLALSWIRRNGVVVRKVEYEREIEDAMQYRRPVGTPYAI